MAQKITARFMIQIAGKPVEKVSEAINFVLKKIKEEGDKSYKVLEEEIMEPQLDDETTLYSGIIDLRIKFETAEKLLGFIVDYTPNSVEVEDPEELYFNNFDFTRILNDMSVHMLKVQGHLRNANAHIFMLNKKLEDLQKKK